MARRALPLEQLAALGLVLILLAATTVGQSALDSDLALAGPLLAVAALLLFFTPRVEVSLAVIALYLGLLDGYLKLSTGSSLAPVGRDVLIFVVVAGVLLRQAVTREQLVRPPFFEHILVFVAFVLVQAANPNAESAQTVANGVRQHLEFVPLFFLGFIVLRDARRLQGALAILLAIGAANGVVGAVQGALTPEQLASWGPGYSAQILGTGAFGNAGRAFGDALGEERVRPQALGSDFGAGGAFAVLAIPAGLALLIRRRRPVQRALAAGGLALSVVALLTSQARLNIIGAVIVVLAFALLTARTRERLRGFLVLAVGVALMYGVITLFVSNTEEGALERYNTLAPSRLVTTVTTDRGDPLALTPTYLVDHFFGVGIGRAGPVATASTVPSTLDAENAFNFLIGEIGTIGMLLLLALWLRVLRGAVHAVRAAEGEQAMFLAGLLAPLFAFLVYWTAAATVPSSPVAPYFWTAAGAVAFHLSRSADALGVDGRPRAT